MRENSRNPPPATRHAPVLILGGGINGAALARELALNGVGVWVVDRADICSGASAYSSRLIHGGLRYLEHAEWDLVRESLAERTRLLRLAPQFVRPLRLGIPVRNRFGGALASAAAFLRLRRAAAASARGLWLVRIGLWLYDRYARDRSLPKTTVLGAGDPAAPPVNRHKYRWVCLYFDAQAEFVERFVLALLDDARRLAEQNGADFRVLTYAAATRQGKSVLVARCDAEGGESITLDPAAIVNATGAWIDDTFRQLDVSEARLIGGTKGSHFVTRHAGLRQALGDQGIYAEAGDGRPVFILPFGDAALVGTTDEPFEGRPEDAIATGPDLDYLLAMVNEVFPSVTLTAADIDQHYAGVRPLPYVGATTPAAITRRHWIHETTGGELPLFSLIGGKLTTCRSLAEEAAATILARLGRSVKANSRDRPIPGGEDYPTSDRAVDASLDDLAQRLDLDREQVAAVWPLCGTRAGAILSSCGARRGANLDGTTLPIAFARWVIGHEWVRALDDLVERRLMLLYHHPLTKTCLAQLAELLVEANRLHRDAAAAAVNNTIRRLKTHYGKGVKDEGGRRKDESET